MDIFGIITSFEVKTVGLFLLFIISAASLYFTVHAFLAETTHQHKIAFVSSSIVLWILVVVSGWRMAMQLIAVPSLANTTPESEGIVSSQNFKITYVFNAPVDFDTMVVHTYPAIDLDVAPHSYFGDLLSIGRKLTLTAKTTLPPGEDYMVYISNIEGPLTRGYGGEQLLKVHTSSIDILEVIPGDTVTSVTPNQTFIVKLSEPITSQNEWSVQSSPIHPFTIEQKDPQTLAITPQTPLSQGTEYTMRIIHTPAVRRQDNAEVIQALKPITKKSLHFATVRSVLLASVEPQGRSVDPASVIRIVFAEPMDRQSAIEHLTVSPAVSLTPEWDAKSKILTLTHPPFTKDSDYSLVFKQGMKTATGGLMESDVTIQFHTAGPVTLIHTDPIDGATDVANTQQIILTFDQAVPRDIARHVTFSPAIAATSSAQEKTITFYPDAPLLYETKYTVTVKKGAPATYGLSSASDQTFSFTVSPTALAVPFYSQETLFTCNIAAARMLLAYRGVDITEEKLIDAIGLGGKRGSGNPYKGYIDDYGTYWDAVARGVNKYRSSRIIKGGKLADIIAEINKGNPVMIWGQNGWSDPHDTSWTATDGTFIKAVNGMHSAVVRGYTGSETNPTQLLLNDPWRGQYGLDTKEFMRRWGYFGVAMAVD